MDPSPYTWRELDDMDWALRQEEWDRTAHLMAAVINSQRVKRPVDPRKLNPYSQQRQHRQRKPVQQLSPLLRYL